MIIEEKNLKNLIFPLKPGDRIFLQGVPGAGKTTFAQELIRYHM
jgi:tRNA A37 threonylcarbamoyladenosine biosynthesis protein TsaE